MARISFSALVEEIVGKLAGSVFQDSYGGYQIRTRVTPRNPQSNYQQLRRGEFGYISSLWRTLTDVQRQTFIDEAITPPAALNLFITSNVNLSLINEAIIDTYVPSAIPDEMTIEFTDVTPAAMNIKATGMTTVVPAGMKLLIQVTNQRPPTRIFTNPSDYSPVISFDEGTDLSSDTDILTEWQSRYGILGEDKRLCLKSAVIDKSNGNRSAEVINCTTSEAMPAKYIPLFVQTVPVPNTGTPLEALVTYTLPGNKIQSDGDRILAIFDAVNTLLLTGNNIQIQIQGGALINVSTTAAIRVTIEVRIVRTAVGTATVTATYYYNGGIVAKEITTGIPIDFTVNNDIQFVATSDTAGTIEAETSSIDLIKAP